MLIERFDEFARDTKAVGTERISSADKRCDELIELAASLPGLEF